jgi:hypothetical protein
MPSGAQVEALGRLWRVDSASVVEHTPAIADKLTHPDEGVRRASVAALGKLEPSALAQYAPALADRLVDTDHSVREAMLPVRPLPTRPEPDPIRT